MINKKITNLDLMNRAISPKSMNQAQAKTKTFWRYQGLQFLTTI